MPIRAPTPEAIADAAAALRRGELVAFPTETVYGLGADATCASAVVRIYEAKSRPRFNPLIVHVPDRAAADRIVHLSPLAAKLADRFWPGPLTIVARRREGCGIVDLVTAGLETIAVRVPANEIAQRLLRAAAIPVAAPSANRSGHVSPTLAGHVLADLGDGPAVILDGGPTVHGLESTIVDASGDTLVQLRAGAVPAEAIEAAIGTHLMRATEPLAPGSGERPLSPGQLASHYAPRARLRLDASNVEPGEALLAFGPHVPPHDGPMISLSERGDMVEAAARLFAALRTLDAAHPTAIAVMPIPATGLGEAIVDRLRRGAAPR